VTGDKPDKDGGGARLTAKFYRLDGTAGEGEEKGKKTEKEENRTPKPLSNGERIQSPEHSFTRGNGGEGSP